MHKDFIGSLTKQQANIMSRKIGQFAMIISMKESADPAVCADHLRETLARLEKVEDSQFADAANAVAGFFVGAGLLSWSKDDNGEHIRNEHGAMAVDLPDQIDTMALFHAAEDMALALFAATINIVQKDKHLGGIGLDVINECLLSASRELHTNSGAHSILAEMLEGMNEPA